MLLIFPILAIICAQALWFVLGKPRFLREKGERGDARVSVVIPARDEEGSIGNLLDSLVREKELLHEIIVVDDGSMDATAEIAREKGALVVSPASLPGGWKGKPWACQEGAHHATGDWVLFLDADTWLEPGGVNQILRLAQNGDRVSSICPYHEIRSPVEELSAFFNVIMVAGVNAFGMQKKPAEECALFGQSLLISREYYEQVGGHEKVKGEVLENFHLAEHLQELGIERDCYLGRGVLSMRMFSGGLAELWGSWKKGFTTGAKQAAPRALTLISIWLTGGMFVLTSLLVGVVLPVGESYFVALLVGYVVYVAQCWWAFRLAGRFSFLNALFFPVGLIFYQVLFFTALIERSRGVKTEWKGRDVD